MIVREWVSSRVASAEPIAPPAQLIAAVESHLHEALDADAAELPDRGIAVAARGVEALVANGRTGREAALDLLALDAIVTYAIEAAAEQGHAREVAERAMTMLSAPSRMASLS